MGFPNINISQEVVLGESSIVINHQNPLNIFAAVNALTEKGGSTIFGYYSGDGGKTWSKSNFTLPDEAMPGSDPQAAADMFGNIFLTYVTDTVRWLVLIWSTDGGATFKNYLVLDQNEIDQPSIAVGSGGKTSPCSVWLSWFRFDPTLGDGIWATGGEVTGLGKVGPFLPSMRLSGSDGSSNFGSVAIGPVGEVMVNYQRVSDTTIEEIVVNVNPKGLTGAFGDAMLATTTNVVHKISIPAQPVRKIDAEGNLAWDLTKNRVFLGYLDSSPQPAANTKVYIRYSDDYGQTWCPPIRVTDDPDSIYSEFNPAIAFDQYTGRVGLTWYDCRQSGPGNNQAQIYGAVSDSDLGGFIPNFVIGNALSDRRTPPPPPSGPFNFGDFDTMDFYNGNLFRAWGDNTNPSVLTPMNMDLPSFNLATALVSL